MASEKFTIKTKEQVEKMRIAGKYLAGMMVELEANCKEGVSGLDLDKIAYDYCIKNNVKPAQIGYHGFPNTICFGVNDNCVHGIPTNRKLKNGDIVSLDVVISYEGWHADMSRTFYVGEVAEETRKFVETVRKSWELAVKEAKIGNRIGAISKAIRSTVAAEGYSPLVEFVGHGIGKSMHEGPIIPGAYYEPSDGPIIREGMVIAIESIIAMGNPKVIIEKDGWTTRTADGSLFAQFENTVVPGIGGAEILTMI